jgi:demethylmenaquinone methyltransferase/2-methoxy-6-polyprenyl-1,4-benzoquinol methylase
VTNRYYSSGDQRAARVKDLFDTIASRYDLVNDLQSFGLHRLWKRRLLNLAQPRPGQRALDLCCGTGDVTRALAQRGVETVGLDFSEPMLAVANARTKARTAGVGLQFLRGDAQQIPFPDNSFDLVTISYGLRNLADWQRGLAEMQRVARPGGRLLVLDFGKPDNAIWRGIYSPISGGSAVLGRIFVATRTRTVTSGIVAALPRRRAWPQNGGIATTHVRVVNPPGRFAGINYGEKPL